MSNVIRLKNPDAVAALVLTQSVLIALIEGKLVDPDNVLRAIEGIAAGGLSEFCERGDTTTALAAEQIVRRFTERLVSLRPIAKASSG